jgi:hypothetical protein
MLHHVTEAVSREFLEGYFMPEASMTSLHYTS